MIGCGCVPAPPPARMRRFSPSLRPRCTRAAGLLRISRTAPRTNCAQTPKHGAENTAICTILRIIRKKCFTNADSRAILISVIIPVTNIEGGASMPIRKNSKKRQVILEALAATTAHPTAQELYQQLKPDYPDLSLGTVYRNLSLFSEQGDVMSVGVFRGQERFDARTRAPRPPALRAVRPRHRRAAARRARAAAVHARPERNRRAGARLQHHVHGAVQSLSASGKGSRFRINQRSKSKNFRRNLQ